MVGWWMAGGEGWLGKGGRLEYQRGTNHGGRGAWLTEYRVPQGGMTPLHLAVEKGHSAIVALLAAKADKEARDEVRRGCRASRGRFGVYWSVLERNDPYKVISS